MVAVVLIIVTEAYLMSWNCRRELIAALKQRKPLLLLRESDASKGATSIERMHADAKQLERDGQPKEHYDAAYQLVALMELAAAGTEQTGALSGAGRPMVMEWHRERPLKETASRQS